MPDMWATYAPTETDWSIYIGTMGFFALLFLLFSRVLPVISIAEMRELILHRGHAAGVAEHQLHGEAGG
jgi:molybdopterin-containing oxidoreductase family membrane subunit